MPFINKDDVAAETQQKFFAYLCSKGDEADGITMAGFMAAAEEMSAAM